MTVLLEIPFITFYKLSFKRGDLLLLPGHLFLTYSCCFMFLLNVYINIPITQCPYMECTRTIYRYTRSPKSAVLCLHLDA